MSDKPPYTRLTHLGDMPVETFLHDYWQKQPLLIRNAFPDFQNPISADELAGFALDDDVNSRLVAENGLDGKTPWQVTHGPLPDSLFGQLPNTHWTLLIQHADLLDPAINALLAAFMFIPSWRLDDIMVSYATDQGSVGPHFDYYDVFLLQTEGAKRWRLGQQCNAQSPLVPNIDLQILTEFQCAHDWQVQPGDLLYIPPGIAHWGVALGESITYSVGFRAPSHSDFLLDYFADVASRCNEDQRYSDPELQQQENPGEISVTAINKLQSVLQAYAKNKQQLTQWFGEYMTRPHTQQPPYYLTPLTFNDIQQGAVFQLNPMVRSAFHTADNETQLYINGQSWVCSRALAKHLSSHKSILLADIPQEHHDIIKTLAENQWLKTTANYDY